ncbi:sortase [Patescibacteria group bacterium]|nr:sortase [Patescibacteria group bacterium]
MPLYRYVKASLPGAKAGRVRHELYSYLLMGVGMLILLWVVWPIVSFSVFSAPFLSGIVAPIPETGLTEKPAGTALPVAYGATIPDIIQSEGGDSSNPNTWFPTQPQKHVVTAVNTYYLSIPKLNIDHAVVSIGGNDLDTSLVHYGGTGIPGDYGTAVVFGHSVLPQFFDPHNYRTIFSTLPTLKPGDDIYVSYDGVEYQYKVYQLVVTDPTDLSSLEQDFDDSYLTLVTCVPPGTTWKRLNVRAQLVHPPAT